VRALLAIILTFLAATPAPGQQPARGNAQVRFQAVDVYVDSGATPLAAYQIDLCFTNGAAKIVGIEGGEHTAFRNPPFYDSKAIQHERVIIAAFSTAPAAQLPSGRTRVATIHLEIRAVAPLQFRLKLEAAADAQGNKIPATAALQEKSNP
jgi:hypothetical protein